MAKRSLRQWLRLARVSLFDPTRAEKLDKAIGDFEAHSEYLPILVDLTATQNKMILALALLAAEDGAAFKSAIGEAVESLELTSRRIRDLLSTRQETVKGFRQEVEFLRGENSGK